MILSEQDRGRTIEAGVGSVVTVRLKENPTTGYRWKVEAMDGLEPVGDRFEAAGRAHGAAGFREFQFRAARTGSHSLRIKNLREWEGDASVIDRFDVTIVVK